MPKRLFDFNSAYAQLILLVFIPISVFAVVGAYLVERESNKAILSEQRTLATAALIRYEPLIKQLLPDIITSQHVLDSQKAFDSQKAPVSQEASTDNVLVNDIAEQQLPNDSAVNNTVTDNATDDNQTVTTTNKNRTTANNRTTADSVSSTEPSHKTDADRLKVDESVTVADIKSASNGRHGSGLVEAEKPDDAAIKRPIESAVERQQETPYNPQDNHQTLAALQNRIAAILTSMDNDQHVERVVITDENGQVLATSGDAQRAFWAQSTELLKLNGEHIQFVAGIPTTAGTAYGHFLVNDDIDSGSMNNAVATTAANKGFWLFVEMDDEPLTITRLRVWLGLGLTFLFTLLLLLLSLNIYAKRWIVPIFNLRLHLQSLTPENMYRPMNTQSTGELNLLQQDLAKLLRRLYGDFQELKDHARQTEADLRDAFDEMEMQNIFIREARDAAVSSSRTKSAFLANISHELRTPLNSIDGFINLLARHADLTAEQELYVQTIRKSSAHLLALVNDVLDFSKIEAGKLVLDKHAFDLYAAIYDVVDMLSPLAAEKGLRMAVIYYNDVPVSILGDELRVKQVLTNLVANAIKFTETGDVVVRVSLDSPEELDDLTKPLATPKDNAQLLEDNEATEIELETIHIAVEDSGQGVSESAKVNLFKSFSQGDPSITRQYGGTGLGLVISKQLTRLMGGQIGFYDNAAVNQSNTQSGQTGATFWFSLPAERANKLNYNANHDTLLEDGASVSNALEMPLEEEDHLALPILHPFAEGSGMERPLEMLVWLNHYPSMQVLKAALQPLNLNITVATSLAGALEQLKEALRRWDWVFIDGGDDSTQADLAALLKQIRLHYQGRLAIYGYQISLDVALLNRYKARGLYQPLDKRQLYHLLDTSNRHAKAKVSMPTWDGVTVLAVDDHVPNLLVLEALLSELGITVVTASSGAQAIDIISRQFATSNAHATVSLTKKESTFLPTVLSEKASEPVALEQRSINDDRNLSANDCSERERFERSQSNGLLNLNEGNIAENENREMAAKDDKARGNEGQDKAQKISNAKKKTADAYTPDKNPIAPTSAANIETRYEQMPYIDLVFMDIQMPKMSGSEATCRIRQIEAESKDIQQRALDGDNGHIYQSDTRNQRNRLPIIALTAQGLSGQQQELTQVGIDDYVGKPISRPELLQILQRWLGRGQVTTSSTNTDKNDNTNMGSTHAPIQTMKGLDSASVTAARHYQQQSEVHDSQKVVDWQDALIRSANKPKLAAQLLEMMQASVSDELDDLEQAWLARDRQELAHISHRILGASRYTGVPQIRQASQNLEDKCLLDVQRTVPSQFAMLKPFYQTLVEAMQALQSVALADTIAEQHMQTKDVQAEKGPQENEMTWKMI